MKFTSFTRMALLFAAFLPETRGADPRFEFTGSYSFPAVRGGVKAAGGSADLNADLGVQQHKVLSFGKLCLKPSRKHRVVFEGAPYAVRGIGNISQRIDLGGQSFLLEQVESRIDLLYVSAGYQYDVINNNSGHLGFSVAGSYLRAEASANSVVDPTRNGSRSAGIPLPVIGGDFHRNLTQGRHAISINADARGFTVPSIRGYGGAFAHGSVQVGVQLMANLIVRAGWTITHLDVHTDPSRSNPFSLKATFTGPVFSVFVRDVRGR